MLIRLDTLSSQEQSNIKSTYKKFMKTFSDKCTTSDIKNVVHKALKKRHYDNRVYYTTVENVEYGDYHGGTDYLDIYLSIWMKEIESDEFHRLLRDRIEKLEGELKIAKSELDINISNYLGVGFLN